MNISEIAKMAGVSSAAVSRYFNNGYISESKKEAIRKVVEETSYRPSAQAQTLRTKKTMLVGVIIPKAASASMGRMVEGILSVLNESSYRMLLAVTQNSIEKEYEYLKTFNEKQVDGVILAATVITEEHKKHIEEMKIPVVIVGQNMSSCSCVYHDDFAAAYAMTDRLLKKGFRPGCISADKNDQAAGHERYRGFCEAISANGMDGLKECVVFSRFSYEAGYEAAQKLLQENETIDSIVCATDEIAAGAQQFIKSDERFRDRQILVTGHGDSTLAKVSYPPIPTVHYYYFESGQKAVTILLEEMQAKDSDRTEKRNEKLGYKIETNGSEI